MIDIKIYQIDLDLDVNRLAFEPFDYVKSVDSEIYQRVYEGSVEAKDLEDVFRIFNIEKPEDYKGRSLSVSDVIEVVKSDSCEPGFYYCDSFGFKEIPFDPELAPAKPETRIKVVMIQPGEIAKVTEIGNTLEELQRAVGGYIEAFYPFEEEVCIVCNDEGKFNGMAPNRAVYGEDKKLMDIIFGPFFICSCAGEDFSGLDQEQAERYQELFALPETFFHLGGRLRAVPYEPEELI